MLDKYCIITFNFKAAINHCIQKPILSKVHFMFVKIVIYYESYTNLIHPIFKQFCIASFFRSMSVIKIKKASPIFKKLLRIK